MDERNSMKLDIETIQSTENEQDQPTESYKQVSEFNSNGKSSGKQRFFLLASWALDQRRLRHAKKQR